jgi:PAS domain-containing protein
MTIRKQFLESLASPTAGVMTTEKLFSKVPDIVFCMKNTSGQYVSANPAFAERLGLRSVDNIIGKTATDLFPERLAVIYTEQDRLILT